MAKTRIIPLKVEVNLMLLPKLPANPKMMTWWHPRLASPKKMRQARLNPPSPSKKPRRQASPGMMPQRFPLIPKVKPQRVVANLMSPALVSWNQAHQRWKKLMMKRPQQIQTKRSKLWRWRWGVHPKDRGVRRRRVEKSGEELEVYDLSLQLLLDASKVVSCPQHMDLDALLSLMS